MMIEKHTENRWMKHWWTMFVWTFIITFTSELFIALRIELRAHTQTRNIDVKFPMSVKSWAMRVCVCVWVLFTVDNFISANRTVFFLVFVYRFFDVLLFFSLPLLLLSHEQYFVSSFATLRRLSVKGTFLIVVVIVVAVVATFCEEHASYSFTCYTYVVCSWSCSMNRIQYFLQNHANVFSLSLC